MQNLVISTKSLGPPPLSRSPSWVKIRVLKEPQHGSCWVLKKTTLVFRQYDPTPFVQTSVVHGTLDSLGGCRIKEMY